MGDWVTKDKDEITTDTKTCLAQCGNTQMLAGIYEELLNGTEKVGKPCVAGSFASKLASLNDELGKSEIRFVRCLKASNPLTRSEFKSAEILNQLQYTGMLDTLKIMQAGFPMRMSYQVFQETFRVLDVHALDYISLVDSINSSKLD